MKLKEKIKQWLFKDELELIKNIAENVNRLENMLSGSVRCYKRAEQNLSSAISDYEEAMETCRNLQSTINDVCDVGVDVALHEPYHNWAVVCIHGKTEFVKFIPIKQGDIQTIRQFLKQFEYCDNRVRVDSPLGYEQYCKPWIVKNPYYTGGK